MLKKIEHSSCYQIFQANDLAAVLWQYICTDLLKVFSDFLS